MNAQDLKNSILQLAVQGKLVEQRAEEGTAEELYQKIQEEKQKLISEGKIKKEKPLPEISEEEIPFEIPSSWKWVRIGDVGLLQTGTTPSKSNPEYFGSEIDFLSPGDIFGGVISYGNQGLTEIGKKYARVVDAYSVIQVCIGGSIGKAAINDRQVTFNQQMNSITPYLINCKFLYYSMICESFVKQIKANSTGTATPIINKTAWGNLIISLPPLEEQKRIVAKIEELLPYIEQYDKAYTQLEEFNKRFPEDMKKSILQYAMQGKLVEQRPEEGTADELYEKIVAEKVQLIKEGKIKKDKPLPEIAEDEVPFEIPSSWKWVRFGEFGNYKKGPFGSALTKGIFVPKGEDAVKVYEQKNAIQKDASLGEYYISREYFESKMKGFELFPGDIIVSCAGTIGETYIMPEDIEQGIINQALMRMKLMPSVYVEYFLLYFDVMLKQTARKSSKGSAIKNIPPFDELKSYLVPLPPLAEQKRIVAKIEELMPLCDTIKR